MDGTNLMRVLYIHTQCGGATGAIRFDKEINHISNIGLSKALQYLRPLHKKYRLIGWADLIQMAGVLAVELAGGPAIQGTYVYTYAICVCT